MKIPKRLKPLIEDGVIDDVVRQLMSGKEATVYMVRCGSEIRCAKVYKDAVKRSFKKAVEYQEGGATEFDEFCVFEGLDDICCNFHQITEQVLQRHFCQVVNVLAIDTLTE